MLSRRTFPLRNVRYFGLANGLIVLGVMIGTAVLTGALLLGDSLRGSLTQLTLDRLGRIDSALLSERFFPASLGERLRQRTAAEIIPAILLRGAVVRRDLQNNQTLARAGGVQVVGVAADFWPLFQENRPDLASDALIINQALAEELQANVGDGLEIRIEKPQAVPVESLLGKRNEEAALVVETSRLAEILPDHGAGRFSLRPSPDDPLIVYVQLERLQRRLTRDQQIPTGAVNALLVAAPAGQEITGLPQALAEISTLEDLGFTLRPDSSGKQFVTLETRRLLFEDALSQKILASGNGNLTVLPLITNLANRTIRVTPRIGEDSISTNFVPYSGILGIDPVRAAPFGSFVDPDGKTLTQLPEESIWINEFVAQDLWPDGSWRSALGKPVIRIEYFEEGPGHNLRERTHTFNLDGVVALRGLGAEKTLTPEFPGMKGTRIADWDPPFPPHQWHPNWIRPRDEQYYRQHRVTPKLFIHPRTAEKLFASRFGTYTSFLFKQPGRPLDEVERAVRAALRDRLTPEAVGLRWQPVRDQGLQAASQGSTTSMFGGLFAGFSFFLILSAALLVSLLFRLRMEKRASEMGVLLATGWSPKQTRRLLLGEGALLALAGACLGLPLAVAYAALMIRLLRAGWGGILSTSALSLHIGWPTLVIGAVAGVVISCLAIVWSLRGLIRVPVPALLAGRARESRAGKGGRWPNIIAILSGLGAVSLTIYGFRLRDADKPGCFFAAGFLALIALVLGIRWYWRGRAERPMLSFGTGRFVRLGEMNLVRSLSRSLSTIALLAAGCFMVVSVGAFRKTARDSSEYARIPGTGGFTLVAESDLPFFPYPNVRQWFLERQNEDPEAWVRLNLAVLANPGSYVPFRLHEGDDVSCLTLYQPQRPRVLGVPSDFVGNAQQREASAYPVPLADRGRTFAITLWPRATDGERGNPWTVLETQLPGDVVPVFLDDHAAQWVLHKQLGDVIELADEAGRAVPGVVAGLLRGSILQSELLISEKHFRKLYPSEAGYRFFLITRILANLQTVRAQLETLFGESHGLMVRTASSRLAAYYAIENTYIGTFQALGGFGLLLGTAGVGIVMLRNVQERRGELALLQAVGFGRKHLYRILFSEVGLLVAAGVLAGCAAAALVLLPVLTPATLWQLLWWLILVALLVPAVAFAATWLGIRSALRQPLVPSLPAQ